MFWGSLQLTVLLSTTKMLTIQSQLLTELSAALTVLLSTTKMLTIQSHFTDNFSGLLLSFL
ncbi:hypothetical protein GFU87_10930 [Lactococcus lactis subsp. lactis]|nr:hypothetical protein [Lactococcus lactis]MRK44916.1 hypothetical protein [Lactococcus lactis subsp. lactis]ONK31281.1 hypothetical protein BZO99_11100 [Lactococcus lactis subsp. lactis]